MRSCETMMSKQATAAMILSLAFGVASLSGGAVHLAAGFALELGPVYLSGGYLVENNSPDEYKAASVALYLSLN
jgi:hypothetical protein